MNYQKIVKAVLEAEITQEKLGSFLGITRQSVSKLADGYELTTVRIEKLDILKDKKIEDIKKIIEINSCIEEIKTAVFNGSSSTIDYAQQAFKYIDYWATDKKFGNNYEKYLSFLFGHIVNFHPRINQHVLLMKDYFNLERFPILTIQVNYNKKLVTEFCIYPIKNGTVYERQTEFGFENFIDELYMVLGDKPRFNLYLDCVDDEWSFIEKNIPVAYKERFRGLEYFDLSRMFNYFEHKNTIGPLLEEVIDQFGIGHDEKRLLKDSVYRAEKITELIKMVSLDKIIDPKDLSDNMFNGYSRHSNNKYVLGKRRKMKERDNE